MVDWDGFPPAKSNVAPDQPLRRKPPSSYKKPPALSAANDYHPDLKNTQYGVANPEFFSQGLERATPEPYGPTDFVVETVKLDKAFFQDFLTARPMLLATDVVTSTSMKVDRERGRDSSGSQKGPDLGSEVDSVTRMLESLSEDELREERMQQMIRNHIKERLAAATSSPSKGLSQQKQGVRSRISAHSPGSPSHRSTSPRPTFVPSTTTAISRQSDVPIFENNVQKFMRYQIPPEIKITHSLHVPKFATSEAAPITRDNNLVEGGDDRHDADIGSAFGPAGPRNIRRKRKELLPAGTEGRTVPADDGEQSS